MAENSFSLCPTCGNIKPAGVIDCEFCSGAAAVSLDDLKAAIKEARTPGAAETLQTASAAAVSSSAEITAAPEPSVSSGKDTTPSPASPLASSGNPTAAEVASSAPEASAQSSEGSPFPDVSEQQPPALNGQAYHGFFGWLRKFFTRLFS